MKLQLLRRCHSSRGSSQRQSISGRARGARCMRPPGFLRWGRTMSTRCSRWRRMPRACQEHQCQVATCSLRPQVAAQLLAHHPAFHPWPRLAGAQPYSVYLSPVAEVVIDCHAHLSHSEVIGVLAGVFDPDTSSISVLRAYPVQEVSTEDNSINVEMDPEDEWRVRQQIDAEGLRVVGWYHSHPTFPTQPSSIDIYNQVLQQHYHRDEACSKEQAAPYIAAIVGPYDKRQLAARSSLTCFYVDHPFGVLPGEGQRPDDVGCVAKVLQTLPLADGGGDSAMAEIANLPSSVLQKLALRYAARRDAVDLMGKWREGCSCAQKLIASLTSRLPSAHWTPGHLQAFVERMQDMINSTLAYRAAPPPPGSALEVGDGAAASGATAAVASTAEQESEEEISDLDPDDC